MRRGRTLGRWLWGSWLLATAVLAACGGGQEQDPTPAATPPAAPTQPATAAPSATGTLAITPPAARSTTTRAASATPSPSSRATPLASATRDEPTATDVPPTATPAPPTPTPELCPGAIRWDQAREHVGEQVTVIGPVMSATFASESRGKPTFLNLGRPYPEAGRFTVLIWIENRPAFPSPPEQAYAGLTICVSGVIELYDGEAEMVVTGPEQIVIP